MPYVQPDVITRRHAESLLPDFGDRRPLMLGTLVCAPPGYGKTVLLANWARGGRSVAWLNIDESDDNPATLCAGMLAAVVRAVTTPSNVPIPQPRADEDALLAQLVDVVDQQQKNVWLVLDDLYRLRDPGALRALESLLRRMPYNLRLVIATRQYPATGLHRLRVAGLLREIRAADLAFTAEETDELLTSHGLQLGADDLRRLMAVTEGWPVAVRLGAAALAESTDHATTLDELAATDRPVTEYLSGEVLTCLSEEQHHLLLCTSVAERFTPELAAELTRHPGAPAVLADLERSNLLVFRCADQAGLYRQHPLLRDYLYASMADNAPAKLAYLHRLASGWYAARGQPVAAARHGTRCGDAEHAAGLLTDSALGLILRGEIGLVTELAALLPTTMTIRVEVGLILALTELMTGERAAAELRLNGLADDLAANDDPRVRDLELIVRSQLARQAGGFVTELDELDRRIPHMSDTATLVFALLNRGSQLFWLGKHDEVATDLEHALRLAIRHGFGLAELHCLSFLSANASFAGDYAEMRRMADDAIELAETRSLRPLAARSFAYTIAANGCFLAVEHDRAAALAKRAVELLDSSSDRNVELYAQTLRTAIEFELGGDQQLSLARLHALWSDVGPMEPIHPALVVYAAAIEQRMALRLARADLAAEAERRAAAWLGDSEDVQLLRTRVHAHYGRGAAARTLLERIFRGLPPTCGVHSLVEAHILAAILAARANDRQVAALEVRTAIELAAPLDLIRPFYEVGQDIRQLLVVQMGRLGRLNQFVQKLLSVIPANGPDHTVELTSREAQLLQELPSLATLDEIAASLFLSVNTVKTHVRNLYRKLGVTSRRAAILTARKRGLL